MNQEYVCERHEIRELPTGYDRCPLCEEEERIEAMEQEMHERRADPRMHPSVDAPRY